jgi:hypothetical protein
MPECFHRAFRVTAELDALDNERWELVHMQPVYVGSNADVLIHSLSERMWSNAYFCVFKRPN